MALNYKGKVYRNIPEQVGKNKEDITQINEEVEQIEEDIDELKARGVYEEIELQLTDVEGYLTEEVFSKVDNNHVPIHLIETAEIPKRTEGGALTYLYGYEDEDYIYYKGTDRVNYAIQETHADILILPLLRINKYRESEEDRRHKVYYTHETADNISVASSDIIEVTNVSNPNDPIAFNIRIGATRYNLKSTFGYLEIEYGTTNYTLTLQDRNRMINKSDKGQFLIYFYSFDEIDQHRVTVIYYPMSFEQISIDTTRYSFKAINGTVTVLVEYNHSTETLTITYN